MPIRKNKTFSLELKENLFVMRDNYLNQDFCISAIALFQPALEIRSFLELFVLIVPTLFSLNRRLIIFRLFCNFECVNTNFCYNGTVQFTFFLGCD